MKKIVYAVLACIIIAGIIVVATMGFKVDLVYSKSAELNVYIGKIVEIKDVKAIVNEVFPNEKAIVRGTDIFGDTVSIVIPEKSDEELKSQLETLNTKLNEKYETDNEASGIEVIHLPKVKLYSMLEPYIIPTLISAGIIVVYVLIRYRTLGMWKVLFSYVLHVIGVEAVFLSLVAITRFPVNEFVAPIGLVLYIATVTTLSFIYEKKRKPSVLDNKN